MYNVLGLLGRAFPVEERYDLWRLATFMPNKGLPVHRWFYFKEGFSRELVLMLLKELGAREGEVVLDPFVGSGTTPLACMEAGYRGVGVDASPLAVFVSYGKTRIYDPEELSDALNRCLAAGAPKVAPEGLSSLVMKAFPRANLLELLSLKEVIESMEPSDARTFLLMALICASNRASYIYREGGVLKLVRRPVPPLRPCFRRTARAMIDDLRKMSYKSEPATIVLGDARQLDMIEDGSVDHIITSPPYLNKIEYTQVYAVELELFFGKKTGDLVRSYIGLTAKRPPMPIPGREGLPDSALLYFRDMEASLREMLRVLRPGGKAAIVVAGGVYPEIVVESDIVLAEIASEVGFEVEKIRVVGKRVATSGRTRRIGAARESILYLRKPDG
jgi:DNA modification methylase